MNDGCRTFSLTPAGPVLYSRCNVSLLALAREAGRPAAASLIGNGNYMESTIPLLLIAAYFLPSILAAVRDQRNTNAIVLLNLFLGRTYVGWVIALAWCATPDT